MFLTIPIGTEFRGSLGQGPDGKHIRRLPICSDSQPPEGVLLLAEGRGNPVAAIGVFDGTPCPYPERSTFALRMGLHLLRLPVRLFLAVYGV